MKLFTKISLNILGKKIKEEEEEKASEGKNLL